MKSIKEIYKTLNKPTTKLKMITRLLKPNYKKEIGVKENNNNNDERSFSI